MKKILLFLTIGALLCAGSWAATLPVPLLGQEKSQWCWDASSLMVLKYNGYDATQTEIANYGVGGYNEPNYLDADGAGPFVEDSKTSSTYYCYGCKQVLKDFGPVYSTTVNKALTLNEVKSEIERKCPALMNIRWYSGGKDVGGHIIVLCGEDSGKLTVNDPWPADDAPAANHPGVTYIADYNAFFTWNGGKYSDSSAAVGNWWGYTLKTGRALDLCFLIDSTGSMGDDIASVKAAATALVGDISKDYKDFRIAVVEYRDNPDGVHGADTDFITKVDTVFTPSTTTAISAINSIAIGNGMDWEEAVYSAAMRTLAGTEIGGWRDEAECYIVMMGDAPGHDPEPWAGGYSFGDVLAYLAALKHPISFYTINTGGDSAAGSEFGALAGASGGKAYTSTIGSSVSLTVSEIITDFTDSPRNPSGDTASIKPKFTFHLTKGDVRTAPKSYFLELQTYNTKAAKWKNYGKFKLATTVKGTTGTYEIDLKDWTPAKPLPIAQYKWRLGYTRPAGTYTLPDGTKKKVPGASIVEENFTEFNRVEVIPGIPTLVSPSSSFSPSETTVQFEIGSGVNADSYAVEIYNNATPLPKTGVAKPWKKLVVKPPKTNPTAASIQFKVSGFKVGGSYHWRAQSLNYDNPKPGDSGWVPY